MTEPRTRVNRVPLTVFRTLWERRVFLGAWVFTIAIAKKEDTR